jgi:hypothetical protein
MIAVVVGALSDAQIRASVAGITAPIPEKFSADLQSENLIPSTTA